MHNHNRLTGGLGKWVLPVCLGILVCSGRASADGCFVAPTANVKITIPDQEALIHYRDGVETLVIETRFNAEGDRFAWLVPLPAMPQIAPVTTGVFPTLRILFQPRVVHNIDAYYVAAILIAFPAICLLCRKYRVFLWYTALLFLGSILLPSFGTAGSLGSATPTGADSVKVHARQFVGSYEIATVSSEQPDALLKWLEVNGFVAPPRTQTAIAAYTSEGWVFAAIKLRRDKNDGTTSAPHPLAFTFPTSRAVYPLRLTGTHDGPCRIDLYVLGSQRASLPGFIVESCTKVAFGEPRNADDDNWGWFSEFGDKLPVGHAGIKALVKDSSVATKLSVTLSPAGMSQDAWLNWEPFHAAEQVVYSRAGVFRILVNVVVILLCTIGVVLAAMHRVGRMSPSSGIRIAVRSTFISLAVSGVAYGLWPKQEVRLARSPDSYNADQHWDVASMLDDADALNPGETLTLDWVTSRLKTLLHNRTMVRYLSGAGDNLFTGEPMIEEDSPGNYRLRVGEKGAEYLWYDRWGAEHVIALEALSKRMPPTSRPATTGRAE